MTHHNQTNELTIWFLAEYETVLLGLRKLRAMGVQNCILKTHSKVITSQIKKECIVRAD
jgi:ribonuclease HI